MSVAHRSTRARWPRARRVRAANVARNRLRRRERATDWARTREAAWEFLDRHVAPEAQVAVIGAGNADDLPLENLATRAATLVLIDLDPRASRRAVHRLPRELRARTTVLRCEVTSGAADRVVAAALRSVRPADLCGRAGRPLPGAPYDVVIGDLLYSQLLYPALLDAQLAHARVLDVLRRHGRSLTDMLVARMHASIRRGGTVVHLHDVAGWWEGHPQPFPISRVLAAATSREALELSRACRKPVGSDPRHSAERLGAAVLDTSFWEWRFAVGVSYLVCATATEPLPAAAGEQLPCGREIDVYP